MNEATATVSATVTATVEGRATMRPGKPAKPNIRLTVDLARTDGDETHNQLDGWLLLERYGAQTGDVGDPLVLPPGWHTLVVQFLPADRAANGIDDGARTLTVRLQESADSVTWGALGAPLTVTTRMVLHGQLHTSDGEVFIPEGKFVRIEVAEVIGGAFYCAAFTKRIAAAKIESN